VKGLVLGLLVVVGATLLIALAGRVLQKRLRAMRDDHQLRPTLWNRFYALDWGDTATNNYGFAPADPDDPAPDRFQRQMYRELLQMLRDKRPALPPGARLVEVSCGRGGGLRAFLDAAGPGAFQATGLDVAASAISYCQGSYEGRSDVSFVEGNAMALPFEDASIDVLLNVEASNDYPDRPRFFSEVRRVLRPNGLFLYADTEKAKHAGRMASELEAAGFRFALRDITANVAEACRLDTPRRREVIRSRAPLPARMLLGKELGNYAAIEGSTKYQRFVSGERRYYMTAGEPA
jgi:ubiquinone/menaquinone biosynthesis C-methylase UbiE